MACECESTFAGDDPVYRRALMAVIAINAVMFGVEFTGGLLGKSQALQTDALDFLGDTLTYGVSLFVLSMAPVYRSMAGMFKGLCLAGMGLFVFASTVSRALDPADPSPLIMSSVAVVALAANFLCLLLLLKFRDGDANVRSVWLCTRNDTVGNVAVIAAAGMVYFTASPWPDLLIAALLGGLFLHSSVSILRQSVQELRQRDRHAHMV